MDIMLNLSISCEPYLVPIWMVKLLDTLGTNHRNSNSSPEAVLIAMILLTMQVNVFLEAVWTAINIFYTDISNTINQMIDIILKVFRRLYECLVVNVESNSKMNVLHYIGK